MKKIYVLILSVLLSVSVGFAQFRLLELPYSYDALEPYIDAATMDIHFNRHHGAFVNNLNNALSNFPEWQDKDDVYLLKNIDRVPAEIRTTIRNNAGGFFNHSLFWKIMAPAGTAPISERMKAVIVRDFGSFEAFQAEFERASASVFWLRLVLVDAEQ